MYLCPGALHNTALYENEAKDEAASVEAISVVAASCFPHLQRMTKNGLVSFFNEGCLYKKKQGREKTQREVRERDRGKERYRKIKSAVAEKSNLTSFLGQSFSSFFIIAG